MQPPVIPIVGEWTRDNPGTISLGQGVVSWGPPDTAYEGIDRFREDVENHKYKLAQGIPPLLELIGEKLKEENGIHVDPKDRVFVTAGANMAFINAILAITDPGDEIILPAPYYFNHEMAVTMLGCRPVIAPTLDNHQLDLVALRSAITERTRAIVTISPNNPSGAIYSEESIKGLAALLYRKQSEHGTEIFIISDEPYKRIIFDRMRFPQVLPHYDNSMVVTSHAKDLALPGERIGYIAVNPNYKDRDELSSGLAFCNRTLGFVNAPALMQHIVRNLQDVSVDAGYYEKKRDYLCKNLWDLGYDVVQPQGAFYLYPKAPIEDDVVFCRTLLNSNVLVVPGRGFGTPGYFRISYCVEDWVLEGAVKGFAKALAAPTE